MEKKTICLHFQVHQPIRLRKYHFFDIGKSHDYYDDFVNQNIIHSLSQNCYLPTNELLLQLINKFGKNFKVSFSISGIAIELFKEYAPEVIESFKKLVKTGCVEFLAETYSHSLVSLVNEEEFSLQVKQHSTLIKKTFGVTPVTFCNTEMIYSDHIGKMVADMGYTAMMTEGAKHVLGWKSPNYLYANAVNPKLKLLLRNFSLSDDITLRFSNRSWNEWPLTAEKYTQWLLENIEDKEIINLSMDYETFGVSHSQESGIFSFLYKLPECVLSSSVFEFLTPSEAAAKHQTVAPLNVPFPISWTDEERDLTSWLGNELQYEAFEELYKVYPEVRDLNDGNLNHDYNRLQSSEHFYYMRTKLFHSGIGNKTNSPYDSPYEAFINYMNILSDFMDRLNRIKKTGANKKPRKTTAKKVTAKKSVTNKEAEPKETPKKSASPKAKMTKVIK